ncbi:MAG: YqgE/AlgH family protein [Chlamydiales bacterium]|nr:YqgE/AlgH family protein [Chlamydiales bacterium]
MSINQKNEVGKGMFLIASPDNNQMIFKRSVILICEHSSAGSFGIIINKPIHIDEDPSELSELPINELEMRIGGPMQPNQMMLLHSSNSIPDQTLEITDNVFLGGDMDFLQTSLNHETPPHLILCLGYTGWLAGQLDQEVSLGDWFIHPAKANQVFFKEPEKLWQSLLREMGGKYASLSMLPDDLNLN